jgi:2-amino-4-hydroxy-6-hydroxymethyldihydropteridine diphosphokinase
VSPAAGRPRAQRLQPSHPAVIALGANLGDRAATIRDAASELDETPGIHLLALSPLVESVAVTIDGDDPDAPAYLNAVALVRTSLEPHALLDELQRIENAHGRVREVRWGSRTLDLDIVDYDGRVHEDGRLTLPHPRAAERAFVLVPWSAVDPQAELAGHGRVVDLGASISRDVHPYAPFDDSGRAGTASEAPQ